MYFDCALSTIQLRILGLIKTNVAGNQSLVTIFETRPFSLLDCVGSSSAAFTEALQNIFKEWEADFGQFLRAIEQRGDAAAEALKKINCPLMNIRQCKGL